MEVFYKFPVCVRLLALTAALFLFALSFICHLLKYFPSGSLLFCSPCLESGRDHPPGHHLSSPSTSSFWRGVAACVSPDADFRANDWLCMNLPLSHFACVCGAAFWSRFSSPLKIRKTTRGCMSVCVRVFFFPYTVCMQLTTLTTRMYTPVLSNTRADQFHSHRRERKRKSLGKSWECKVWRAR